MSRIVLWAGLLSAGCFPEVELPSAPLLGDSGLGGGSGEEGGGGDGDVGGGGVGGGEGSDGTDTCIAYFDSDGDGYGAGEGFEVDCEGELLGDQSWSGEDCDDTDFNIHPEAAEVCNGVDDDCDELVDDADPEVDTSAGISAYTDADGDGYGDPDSPVEVCREQDGVSLTSDDCDDSNVDIHPEAAEVCNARDDDCDGTADSDAVCPCPVEHYGDRPYLFCEDKCSWLDAEGLCEDHEHYHLVVIDDASEQAWVWDKAFAQDWFGEWWIGYHNRNATEAQEPEGGWEWVDGSSGGYENWYDQWPWEQPDDADGDEDCAWLDSGDGMWSDADCDGGSSWDKAEHYFVCEGGG